MTDPTFAIIGHDAIQRVLDAAVAAKRLRHAYLFHGRARVGKSTVGRWLAARLLCTGPAPPCGACRACRRIVRAAHPDVRMLQAPGERGDNIALPLDLPERPSRAAERAISIEQVRALQHDAALASAESSLKVYLVVGAENMSLPAANALLKTLEEPPNAVLLILTATDAFDLLPTIVSRCQLFRFGAVPMADIARGLQRNYKCSEEQAELVARLSGGRPGWAIDAVADTNLVQDRDRALDDLEPTLPGGFRERLNLAERLASGFSRDQSSVYQTLSLWHVWWWDVYLLQTGCRDLLTNVDRIDALASLAAAVRPSHVQTYLKEIGIASARLAQNVNPRLALETLLLASPVAG